MEKNNIFNIKRFSLILKRDIFVNLKTILIVFGVFFGFTFIVYLIAFLKTSVFPSEMFISKDKLAENFYQGFFIIGIIISGIAFSDFRTKLKSQNYLMIPASTTEKFLSTWLITTIAYIIAYYVIFIVFNALLLIIGKLFSVPVDFLNIFTQTNFLRNIGIYLIIQSMFLAGAASFSKSPLLKTPLVGFIVFIAFMILLSFAALALFQTLHFEFHTNMNLTPDLHIDVMKIIGKILAYITPFVFWSITFFKLKEKQV